MEVDTPSSVISERWALLAGTDTSKTSVSGSPHDSPPERVFIFKFPDLELELPVTYQDFSALESLKSSFLDVLDSEGQSGDQSCRSPIIIVLQFIQFLFDYQAPLDLIKSVLRSFRQQFHYIDDFHKVISDLSEPLQRKKQALRTYYAARSKTLYSLEPVDSALLNAADAGLAKLFAVFGGQGSNNPKCVLELRDVYSQYQPLLQDLVDAVEPLLRKLSRLPETRDRYQPHYPDLSAWLRDAGSVPDQDIVAAAGFSLPLIGLTSLARFQVACRILNKTPGELRHFLHGITGHSQGIVVAAAVAGSESWRSFFDNAKLAIEILFWIGFESEQAAPHNSFSASVVEDSLEHGEGRPASMLRVQGLCLAQVEEAIQRVNSALPLLEERAYVALINARDNFVIAGPAKSLHGLNIHLRDIKAAPQQDQSRVPFSRRTPIINNHFLPINVPFHSPHLDIVADRCSVRLAERAFHKSEQMTPVYRQKDGMDIWQLEEGTVIEELIRSITIDTVDWPVATRFSDATHIVAFDSGVGALIANQDQEGRGIRIIMANEIEVALHGAGPQAELFSKHLTKSTLRPQSWDENFRPRVTELGNGGSIMDTKLSRLLGTPPVMVAGMTPTTVHWDFVAAIMNAGYHAELAGGGYLDAHSMSKAIRKLASNIPVGRGITCNLIYVSPKAMAWQIPMIGQLIREGVPIDGLTIGAGVPSLEVAADYIMTLGLKHISFKPGSLSAIRQVIGIADAHPSFPIILQWTGGRGGGHHSFEDFHQPLLEAYAEIRRQQNIVLVVGSGFGGADDTYPYITGTWAHEFGRCSMPVDGILLGSRMMIAKESHTSPQSKRLIVEAPGSHDWQKCYDGESGGVMTVQSEMGQPIHKIATRGVRLWAELDKRVFNLPKNKRMAELQKNRKWIVQRLHDDFAKPWFGKSSSGALIDISDMTYGEVLTRLIELMYISHQQRWVDISYAKIVHDISWRTMQRLSYTANLSLSELDDPRKFLEIFLAGCPSARTLQVHPEDVHFIIKRFKERGSKPVNFVPALDEDFEFWFKKDSLWQSEDIDAIFDQDAGRVCILHGPTSAFYSRHEDESAKDILDGICSEHIKLMSRDDLLNFKTHSEPMGTSTNFPLGGHENDVDWFDRLKSEQYVYQDNVRIINPFRQLFKARCIISVHRDDGHTEILLTSADGNRKEDLALIRCFEDSRIDLSLHHTGKIAAKMSFRFQYHSAAFRHCLTEDMQERDNRIKLFYRKIWLGTDLSDSEHMDSVFESRNIVLTNEMLQKTLSTVGKAFPNNEMTKSPSSIFPIDICVIVAWEVLTKPLLVRDFEGDLLKLVHLSNTSMYVPGASPLQVSDTVSAKSSIEAVTIEPAGKSMTVNAEIQRAGETIATVISRFLFKGKYQSATFQHSQHPEIKLHINDMQDEIILRDREWLQLEKHTSLVGKTLIFRLETESNHSGSQEDQSRTAGLVFESCQNGLEAQVGRVDYKYSSTGNPIIDYLERKCDAMTSNSKIPLDSPGWTGSHTLEVTMPSSNDSYARLSGDYNPIHVSPIFADWAGLPGTISHGMLTAAIARGAVEHLVGDEQRGRFRKWSASFVGMVLLGDKITVSFRHVAMVKGAMVLQVSANNRTTGEKVLEGEAEIEQVETAYVFTGQGSQSKGMGMALYDSSPVAKRIWDEADRVLEETYGKHCCWSMRLHCSDLVQDGPSKELFAIIRKS